MPSKEFAIDREMAGAPLDVAGAGATQSQPTPEGRTALDRLASFRFAYLAIVAALIAYVFTVEGIEVLLLDHFRREVNAAASVPPETPYVAQEIASRVGAVVERSAWVRLGDVRVEPLVLGADGSTLLYAGGGLRPAAGITDASKLLPPLVRVTVSVPHNGLLANAVLVTYASLLVSVLAIHTRRLAARERERMAALTRARDTLSERARGIEGELEQVRTRLAQIEPEHVLYAEEIDTLASERGELLERLRALEQREEELRMRNTRAQELAEERRALESLLEEASQDLAAKEAEIDSLRSQVKQSARGAVKAERERDVLERRFRTLYKNLEVDERALDDIVALGDESLKLRAEEVLKRLCDDPDQTIVRRKVGGLPPHLSIFELAFAGKGRIYFSKGESRRFRILLVGAKNSQKADLEYLSRLPRA
jgi:hypothetical protein